MSAGLTGASALLSGVSQYEAGQARSSLFRGNANIALQQAQSEAAAGGTNETMVRMKGAQITGQQIAATGANNLQQTGTPAQVIASTAGVNEMDALQTRNNALRRAWGFRVQAASDEKQAGLAATAGDFNAAGSILSGGAKAYDQYNKAGSFF